MDNTRKQILEIRTFSIKWKSIRDEGVLEQSLKVGLSKSEEWEEMLRKVDDDERKWNSSRKEVK